MKLQLLQGHFPRSRLALKIHLAFSPELSWSLVVYGPLELVPDRGEWYFGLSHVESHNEKLIKESDFFFKMHSRKVKFLNTLENLSKEVIMKNAHQILETGC